MCTIFFHKSDYREAMRDPHGSFRCHAICRKLTGCSATWPHGDRPGEKMSTWYGAHYWAACAVTTKFKTRKEAEDFYKRTFAREVNHHPGTPEGEVLKGGYLKLWKLALKRVRKIWPQAKKLKNSNLW